MYIGILEIVQLSFDGSKMEAILFTYDRGVDGGGGNTDGDNEEVETTVIGSN